MHAGTLHQNILSPAFRLSRRRSLYMRTLETALLPVDSCGVKLAWQLTQRAPQLPCIANVSFGCSANRGEIWTTCSGRFRMGTEPASEMACGYHVRDRKPFFCHGVDGCSRRPSEAPPPPARPPEAMTSTRKPPCTSGGQLVEPGGIWRAQTPEELAATFVPPSVTTADAALARLAHNERGASASTSSGSASFVGSWGHLVDWDALTEETRCCDFSALDPCNVVHPRHNLGGDAHLTFEPHACSLPLPASTRVALPSRVRFVGDSVSRQHFVAFGRYTRASTCVFRCFAQRAGSVTTWARAPSLLTQAGYAPDVADRAVAWLRAHQGARNVSSCGGRPQCAAFEFCEDDDVSYGRLDKLPPPSDEAVVGAAMHLLVYGHTTRGPLGPNDYLVANWGMHGRESRAAWPAVMRWWRKQAARGRAPRLIHREQAPTHWHGTCYASA